MRESVYKGILFPFLDKVLALKNAVGTITFFARARCSFFLHSRGLFGLQKLTESFGLSGLVQSRLQVFARVWSASQTL